MKLGLFLGLLLAALSPSHAQDKVYEDKIGAGDTIRVQVYQSPDLSLETRVLESGHISYPLIGATKVAGLTIPEAEKVIGLALKAGGFMQQPQVSINLMGVRRKQIVVIGSVGRPGPVQLEALNIKLSDVLAIVGGVTPNGSDNVIVMGTRNGKPMRKEIDVASIFLDGKTAEDIAMAGGDIVYVHRAPMYYVYGETQSRGPFRLERNMTFIQALVTAGGPTSRGSEKRLRVSRKMADGKVKEITPELTESVQVDDVIFVPESLF